MEALDPNGPRILRIFYDNNQRVYTNSDQFADGVGSIPIRLTLNLRNTQRIHELVCRHYTGYEIQAIGAEGVEVQWITVISDKSIEKRISDCVRRLVAIEQIPRHDIAVLVDSMKAIKNIAPRGYLGGFHTTRCDESIEDHIVVDSIRRFKGLERRVVLVAATSDIATDRELPYVALSRARVHLVVVGTNKVLNRLRGVALSNVDANTKRSQTR